MVKTIDPWGSSLPEDYVNIMKSFGLEEFKADKFPNPNRLMRREVVFAGRDLELISKCIKDKKKFYVLSGIMPTNDKIHFGNKMVVEQIKYFQDQGGHAYILVADLESAAARGVSLKEARKRALEFHIPAYVALGLDPEKTTFYFQSDNRDVIALGFEFAKKITLNEFQAIYGSADPGRIMSAVIQCGDILFPQLTEEMPGIIPVGIDQDPHIRLTRDIAKRTKTQHKFFPPSSIYHKYMPALNGNLKMSKSDPLANIDLPEDEASFTKKINRAVTGGRATLEEHKKLGAEVEKCMIFELLKMHLIDDDNELQKIYDDYKSGNMTSGEIKQIAISKMKDFMQDFNKKLEDARNNVDKLNFIKYND